MQTPVLPTSAAVVQAPILGKNQDSLIPLASLFHLDVLFVQAVPKPSLPLMHGMAYIAARFKEALSLNTHTFMRQRRSGL